MTPKVYPSPPARATPPTPPAKQRETTQAARFATHPGPNGPHRVERSGELRAQGCRTVARALGHAVQTAPRRGLSPCPACQATQRGRADGRPPAEITSCGMGWRCHVCGASGDALSLAAAVVVGNPRPSRSEWARVFDFCAGLGLCSPMAGEALRPPVRLVPPAAVVAVAPSRPPAGEVAELWARCVAVSDCASVAEALLGRGLSAAAVDEREIARALPADGALPSWASTWRATGHLLVVKLYDTAGEPRSLHARRMGKGAPAPKGAFPRGFEVRGLCMADGPALELLRGDAGTAWCVAHGAGLLVAEGVPDFLAYSCAWGPDKPDGWRAVVGIVAGSWTAELAARVPSGTSVAVATHDDDAGHRYASAVRTTLEARCRLLMRTARNAA